MGVPQAKVAPNRNVMLDKNDLILGAPLCSVIDWEQTGEVWPQNEYYDGSIISSILKFLGKARLKLEMLISRI